MTLREIAGIGFFAAGCACLVVAVWLEPELAEVFTAPEPVRRRSMRVPLTVRWTKAGDA